MMNENYAQPDLRAASELAIIRGCYLFNSYSRPSDKASGDETRTKTGLEVTLLGSGAILLEVIKAAELLAAQGIAATVFSVTSLSELARDGAQCQQRALASGYADPVAQPERPSAQPDTPFIATQLQAGSGPIIAATDYVRAVPESIRAFVPAGRSYLTLGTDGFGRSDTRAALRQFFGVDAQAIVRAALHQLQMPAR